MKSYEVAYKQFIEACSKWVDAYYAHHRDYNKPAVGQVHDDGSDRRATYCRQSDLESQMRTMAARYVTQRLEHEKKYGGTK